MPTINGTSASETLTGSAGDDTINDVLGGADVLQGLGGNDTLYVARSYFELDEIRVEGGDGDDTLILDVRGGGPLRLDGGDGQDLFRFWSVTGSVTLTTGAGPDRIQFDGQRLSMPSGKITITDFTTGTGGDFLDLVDWLPRVLRDWAGQNPFATGHLSLVQVGADTELRLGYQTLVVFLNTSAAAFTAANLGYSPDGVGGAAGIVLTGSGNLVGTNGEDVITGGAGADVIVGQAGDDRLDGGDGSDQIYGGIGSDIIHGGAGADIIEDGAGVGDTLYGDGGDDRITVYRTADHPVSELIVDGGAGNDVLSVRLFNASTVHVNGGDGDDLVEMPDNWGDIRITTGAGRDRIDLNGWIPDEPPITITDFTVGAGGDQILWLDVIDYDFLAGLGGNPFASGHARLIQVGADTLLQFDRDGGGNAWITRVIFQNTSAPAFTADNFQGYAPSGAELSGSTLTGTADLDYLDGTRGDDTITALGGDDRIRGQQGHDVIHGGDGNDIIEGGGGSDTLWGDAGDDQLSAGESGADILWGGDGADVIDIGRDYTRALETVRAFGDAGADTIYVSLTNGASAFIDGGAGDDAIFAGSGGLITIATGAGADTITYGRYTLMAPSLVITDFAVGTDRFEWIDFRNAFFYGLSGNPFLSGHARLIQDGDDAVLQFDRDGAAGSGVSSQFIRFQNVQATALSGAPLGFQAVAFDHTAGSGADTLVGSYLADRLDGGAGGDVLRGGGGDDTLIGGAGFDIASYEDATGGVTVNLGLTGPQDVGGGLGRDSLTGIEGLTGSAFADHLIAGATAGTLSGGAGDDILQGGAAIDNLRGGDGDDLLDGGTGADTLRGEAGDDVIRFSVAAPPVSTQPVGLIDGGAGRDTLDLTAAGPAIITFGRLTLGAQYNIVGVERILTGAADDAINLSLQATALEIDGGVGNDTIQTGFGDDHLSGGLGDDYLSGGAGDDLLVGGQGNDIIIGGDGVDVLEVSGSFDLHTLLIDGAGFILKSADGRDRLTGVEYVRFADGRILDLLRIYDAAKEGDGPLVLPVVADKSGTAPLVLPDDTPSPLGRWALLDDPRL
ncbi:MAG: calcium-binding protein, partial [Brevundimonas sp.]